MSIFLCKPAARRRPAGASCRRSAAMFIALVLGGCWGRAALAQGPLSSPSIVHLVQTTSDRVTMTIHSSRLLTLDQKIPRAQVNNPDLLDLTPISARQVQIYAKKAGITQVNLWDEKGEVHLIDVIIEGDVRELAMILKKQFPNASINVDPNNSSVILSGYVDRPDHISRVMRIAEEYYPKVINNITVGGAQQVLLHVKVMEVSRTKLRNLGFDFAQMSSSDFFASSIGGALTRASATQSIARNSSGAFATTGAETVQFGVLDQNASFFAFITALQRNQLIKTLAEPTLVTVSGRPAYFLAGGSLPYPVPSGLGTTSIAFKPYGTQLDFVPIVQGNGVIRLEVRPSVSEIDNSVAITINGTTVPGFTNREVETGVEMKVGQTLALAGLISTRLESSKSQIPWLGDLPLVGTLFRNVNETMNEVDLLILVRPEIAEAMDCHEVPLVGPGENTDSPSDAELYLKGYQEVPTHQGGPAPGPDAGPPLGPMPPGVGPGIGSPPPRGGEIIVPGPAPAGGELPAPARGTPSATWRPAQPGTNAAPPGWTQSRTPAGSNNAGGANLAAGSSAASNSLPSSNNLPSSNGIPTNNSAGPNNAAGTTLVARNSPAAAAAIGRPAATPIPAAAGTSPGASTGSGQLPPASTAAPASAPSNPAKPKNRPPVSKKANAEPPGFLGATGYDVTK